MAGDPFKEFTVKRKKGEMIYVEGDLGSEMYVVQSGAVRIYRTLGGVKQELAIMEKGDFFGEIAVLEGLPRTASAEALDSCEIIEINSTTFDKMIREHRDRRTDDAQTEQSTAGGESQDRNPVARHRAGK